mmetsp:Transcript_73113/g.145009  ORF Transcript_73113/g.145009 Transcript_73113/m.145009 type:complete len:521 (-) Transcript_73113:49-1611(-)
MGQLTEFLDTFLTYKSPRYADVHDWRLGLAYRIFQVVGLGYVVFWAVVYKCDHLRRDPVSGYARVDISTPVKDGCFEADATCKLDLRSFAELPYCIQGKAQVTAQQRICEFRDAYALSPQTPMPNSLFVPSFVNRMLQRKVCEPSAGSGWRCEQTYVTQAEEGKYQHGAFVADIERYRLLISHSYEASDSMNADPEFMGRSESTLGELSPAARPPPGSWKPWHSHIQGVAPSGPRPHIRAHVHHALREVDEDPEIPSYEGGNTDFGTLYHSPWGDMLSLGDLIKLADPRGAEAVLSERGENDLSRRERGGVIAISIEYTNERSFDILGLEPPRYRVSARLLPMQWLYQSHAVPAGNDTRHIEAYQGFLIHANVHGHIRRFEWLSLLQVLATALVLLTVAGMLTDAAMAYTTELAQRYELIRQQPNKTVQELRSLVGQLQDEEGRLLLPADANASPELEHEEGADSSRNQELLAVLRSIEKKLNGPEHHFVRNEAADSAGAHFENLASGLLDRAAGRVAPL